MASVFLESIRDFMTTRRYAKRTIDTYQYWQWIQSINLSLSYFTVVVYV